MATLHEPFLFTPKGITPHCRIFCLLLSLAAIISSVSLVAIHLIKLGSSDPLLASRICDQAHDPASCSRMVSEVNSHGVLPMTDLQLLQSFLKKTTLHIHESIKMANDISHRINDAKEHAALVDCVELMDLSMDRILDSVLALRNQTLRFQSDAQAWLSGALTNYDTCLDGLNGEARLLMEPGLKDLITRGRVSLAMLVAVSPSKEQVLQQINQEFPPWITSSDRRLLRTLPKDIQANVVVAKDGSGKYKTVQEAVTAAPSNSKTRYVIYVKKGTYKEKVEINKNKKNLMLVGDGMDLTIITGSLNVVDGSTTFNSATVAAVGDGFIAQDIWFQNTAGAQKHQAVALRVGADQSVINRCRVQAYQDTLYAHSNRQFYRDCFITGTVDFIFGNAAVVFQNCTLIARKPMDGQSNMVTAQGRIDPNQNTGTSIQYCNIIASNDLEPVKSRIKSYLGRPWKEYSRTVIMQSHIGGFIDPAGWSPWSGDFALKTLYYGEYLNRGPGAVTSKRVKWPGYHIITSVAEAKKFTVAELIQGGSWLKSTGVTFEEGLS